jgi:hypothetical protein
MEIILKAESYAIVGACFEVYNVVGPGFPNGLARFRDGVPLR